MLPWRPAGAARPRTPPRPAQVDQAVSSPTTDDEDSEELSAPPSYYFTQVKEIFPESTKRDGLRAWDLSAKENWKGATEQDRVQGAILKMEEVMNPLPAKHQPQADANFAKKRKIDDDDEAEPTRAGKGKEKALFLSDDEDDSQDVKIEEGGGAHSSKKRRISEIENEDGARGKVNKGKGKAREVDMVISDDDDDVLIVAETSKSKSGLKGKGKGKERQVELDLTASLDDITPPRAAPLKARSPSPPPSPLAQLLQLLPDLLPSCAEEMLASPQFGGDLDKIMDHLLSISGGYPKVEIKKEAEKKKEIDWADVNTRKRTEGEKSVLYKRLALDQLNTDFATLPTTLIKSTYLSPEIAGGYFAPAYLSLYTRSKAGEFNAQLLKKRRKPTKKLTKWITEGVDADGTPRGREVEERDEGLDEEMEWVKAKLLAQRKETKKKLKLEKEEQEEQERMEKLDEKAKKSGKAKECQCCFDEYASANIVACEKGHLFCKGCATRNASHRIGDQQYTLPCMTECDAFFSPQEYKNWLPEKMRATLERLQADKELEMAFEGVEGFEKCPFCPFAMYIENENERLFTCLNTEECGKVSCRKCQKEGHVPLTCEEADKESRMGGIHAVEDAMAEAMIRSCPKCQLRYYKSEACNKITCSKCGTKSCYVCQAIVKDYTHFDQSPPGSVAASSSKCPLWDDTEVRHFNEVEEARKRAQASLDSKTQEYTEKLAADRPERQAPQPYVPPVANYAYQPIGALNPPQPPQPYHYYYPPAAAPPQQQAPRPRGRQVAAQRALALQAAQFEQQQRMIFNQQQQLQLALERQQALAIAIGGGARGGGQVHVHFQAQPPQIQQAQPAPANPAAARQARLDAAMRRIHQG